MDNITKPSKRFAVLFRVLFFIHPVLLLVFWMYIYPTDSSGWLGFRALNVLSESGALPDIDLWQRLACFGAALLPGAAIMYVYLVLSRLFTLYAHGVFFGKGNVSCYRAIAYGLIAQQFLFMAEEALQTLLLTIRNPEGERLISVGFDDANVSLLIVGLMIILISRIMDEGRKIQEEQSLTV
ncbi:DUF2975 domain-containing protein [Pseudodesulfovibrio indicus]|uniref:DUF2975 domain-containing protein n=1 Tax=Pseudodesulfovibrio indicus TaxID=1716143 RepID=UPI00292EFEF6|nr:DUF2975 domain-containing protein [Pseudodesulfovibrio indicus]